MPGPYARAKASLGSDDSAERITVGIDGQVVKVSLREFCGFIVAHEGTASGWERPGSNGWVEYVLRFGPELPLGTGMAKIL